jgi:hypothetical protein
VYRSAMQVVLTVSPQERRPPRLEMACSGGYAPNSGRTCLWNRR